MMLRFGTVPFSFRGSYIAFSYPQDSGEGYEKDLTIRSIYGVFDDQDNYPVCLLDKEGRRLRGEVKATETELCLTSIQGKETLRFCFQSADTVCLKGNTKIMLTKRRMEHYDRVLCHDTGLWEITGREYSLWLKVQTGTIENYSPGSEKGAGNVKSCILMRPDENGQFLCQMTLAGLSYQQPELVSYEEAVSRARKEYDRFASLFVTRRKDYQQAVEEAAYILWSSVVRPEGYVKYPAMLMSKNKMNMIWSWDYAINALAVVDKEPELAYEQFLSMAECQDKYGAYADCYSARNLIRGFVKPPVQGFVLKKMFAIRKPSREIMEKLYQSVSEFTQWWFQYRGGKDGIPEYCHGNDSGWDNSTVFSLGVPVKSPDLCTWLIIQMDFLAELSQELGLKQDCRKWEEKSEKLLNHMLEYFVRDNEFVAYKVPEMCKIPNDSLLMYIPLLLGKRIPEKLRQNMLGKLLEEGKFFTSYGMASEALDSLYFVEDGYWRGAVWPPTAWIFTEILVKNGKGKEAVLNAESFCEMCRKYGFFENYSAKDGHGLRDSGYTWTASAFLILLRDYLENVAK